MAETEANPPKPISMDSRDPLQGLAWQAEHCRQNGAPLTARVLQAMLPLVDGPSAVGQRIANWPGNVLEDSMPLRLAGGLHWLHLSGADGRLGPVYAGAITAQTEIDVIVGAGVADHDAALLPWFDGPPQTNEAGRSAGIVAGLLWLAANGGGDRFELNEIGASAGANTMIERYDYDLGGVSAGPADSPVLIRPDWQGPPPPAATFAITAIAGCDQAPIDLADPVQALRLKAYVWAENAARLSRLDAVIGLARAKRPDLVRADAAYWAESRLARPQDDGVTRVLYHSIVWQYLTAEGRARIEAALNSAGARATNARPLAWVQLETNRATFRHELRVRRWPGPDEPALLGEAHAHGAWVRWFGQS